MFGGNEPHGFTVVEIMIFLSISGIIFFSVVNLVSQRQKPTYFLQGSRTFYSQMQSLAADVNDGYYNDVKQFSCNTVDTGAPSAQVPQVSPGGGTQGQNYGCTFIGYAIQFSPQDVPSTAPTTYNVYAVFARQFELYQNSGSPPADFQDALPVPELVSTVTIPSRFKISSVNYTDSNTNGGSPVPDSIVGFFYNFAQSGSSQGSLATQLVPVPVPSAPLFYTGSTAKNYISSLTNAAPASATTVTNSSNSITPINPSQGVDICLKSTDYSNRFAKITIGGNDSANQGNPLSVQYSTFTGAACS